MGEYPQSHTASCGLDPGLTNVEYELESAGLWKFIYYILSTVFMLIDFHKLFDMKENNLFHCFLLNFSVLVLAITSLVTGYEDLFRLIIALGKCTGSIWNQG